MALSSPYTDNAPTPAPNTTVGFKLSKPGYDANRSSGSNFIFNSSWPSLPIAFERTITGDGTQMSLDHNFKFAPFSMAWYSESDASGIGTVGKRIILRSNTTKVYITTTVGVVYKVRCFQLDLGRDIDYTLAPGDTFSTPYDPNFGIKVVKPNKNIDSKDLRDFSLHSRAQSPLILAVKTEATIPAANLATAIGNVIQYTSKLSYPVWVYGFIKAGAALAATLSVTTGSYIPAPYYAQAYPRTFTDGLKTYIGYLAADSGATIVILRDPMFNATSITAQY